jgi:glycosyltransferase involved in cell wall biosynthesis
LSPNKGIENVILALPEILARHPRLIYIVAGATHPHILRRDVERYRDWLRVLAEKVGVSSHVLFNNRFVKADELIDQLGVADRNFRKFACDDLCRQCFPNNECSLGQSPQ